MAAKKVKVGAQLDLKGPGFVRLPDGSVTSTSRLYEVKHEGEHVATTTPKGRVVTTTYEAE